MSTRCKIATVNPDKTVKAIYCHFDGYYAHVGKMLYNHYNTQEKIDELLALGALETLHENINPDPNFPHNETHAQVGVVFAYERDGKGTFDNDFKKEEFYENADEYLKTYDWADHLYLWDGEKWIADGQELTPELIESDENDKL